MTDPSPSRRNILNKKVSHSAQVSVNKDSIGGLPEADIHQKTAQKKNADHAAEANKDSLEHSIRIQSDLESEDDEGINMKPIDIALSIQQHQMHSNSSPSKYSKISLSKMSSTSLIYKKKMDRLMHSIKVQCVCDDCDCQKRYGDQILEEEGQLYGQFHQDWEEFIGSTVFIHQLKILK